MGELRGVDRGGLVPLADVRRLGNARVSLHLSDGPRAQSIEILRTKRSFSGRRFGWAARGEATRTPLSSAMLRMV